MRILAVLHFLLLACPAASAASSGAWQIWKDCTLDAEKYFDGDSFHIRHGRKVVILRLYFIDAPETDDSYAARVTEQAAYFKVNRSTVLHGGEAAKRFTEKFLSRPFRVITREQAAPGASQAQRYYAIVETAAGRLDAAMVAAGLARTSSEIADYPDAAHGHQAVQGLRIAEQQAAKARRGLWAYSNARPVSMKDALQPTLGKNAGAGASLARVNLNKASASELAALPGVGPKTAEQFIHARPIKSLEALDAIPGIGPKKLEALRDLVRFE